MKFIFDSFLELLKLIPINQRWIVVCALIAGLTYWQTNAAGQREVLSVADTYSAITNFVHDQDETICNARPH